MDKAVLGLQNAAKYPLISQLVYLRECFLIIGIWINPHYDSSANVSLFVGHLKPEGISNDGEEAVEREEEDDDDDVNDDDDDEDPAYAIEKMRRKIAISEERIADFQGTSIPQTYLCLRWPT